MGRERRPALGAPAATEGKEERITAAVTGWPTDLTARQSLLAAAAIAQDAAALASKSTATTSASTALAKAAKAYNANPTPKTKAAVGKAAAVPGAKPVQVKQTI